MNTISSKKAVIYALYLPTKNMKKKKSLVITGTAIFLFNELWSSQQR